MSDLHSIGGRLPEPPEIDHDDVLVRADHDGDVSRILCPFCSAPWTDDMVTVWHESFGCQSGGYDTEAFVDITCHNCKRLIYRKSSGY